MEITFDNDKLVSLCYETKRHDTKANKKSNALRYRIKIPNEIFKGMYCEWIKGLKIYLYKKDENIFITSKNVQGSIEFSLLKYKSGNSVMLSVNKNMDKLQSDWKNKKENIFIVDNSGIKLFFK